MVSSQGCQLDGIKNAELYFVACMCVAHVQYTPFGGTKTEATKRLRERNRFYVVIILSEIISSDLYESQKLIIWCTKCVFLRFSWLSDQVNCNR